MSMLADGDLGEWDLSLEDYIYIYVHIYIYIYDSGAPVFGKQKNLFLLPSMASPRPSQVK